MAEGGSALAGPGHVLGHLGQRRRLLSAGQVISAEAQGGATGQVAVGAVILNRVPLVPNTISGCGLHEQGPSAACMTGRLMGHCGLRPSGGPGRPERGGSTGGAIY